MEVVLLTAKVWIAALCQSRTPPIHYMMNTRLVRNEKDHAKDAYVNTSALLFLVKILTLVVDVMS